MQEFGPTGCERCGPGTFALAGAAVCEHCEPGFGIRSDGSNCEICPRGYYTQAGLCVLRTLLAEPYLSVEDAHEGLLLHAVYHRPNGWDAGGEGGAVPRGESCMWGDYHLRELALYVQRLADGGPPLQFFRSEDPGP